MTDRKPSQLNKVLNSGGSDVYLLTQASSASTVGISASAMLNGWINDNVSWSPLSTGSGFTRANGNQVFDVGVKLKFVQGGITRYAYSGATTGTGGSVVNTYSGTEPIWSGSAISNQEYSYVSNPLGFPNGFSFTPVWTGLGVTGAPIYTGRFSINGRIVKCLSSINKNSGTVAGSAVTTYCALPITNAYGDVCLMSDSNVNVWSTGLIFSSRFYPPPFTNVGTGTFIYFSGNYEI